MSTHVLCNAAKKKTVVTSEMYNIQNINKTPKQTINSPLGKKARNKMSNWYNFLSTNFSLANSHYRKIWKITFEPYIIENQGSQTERRKYKSQHAIEAMK